MIAIYTGVQKSGIRGIQDTRQINFGKTIAAQNNDEKAGPKAQLRQNYTDIRQDCKTVRQTVSQTDN